MPAGRSSTSIPGSPSLVLGLGQAQPSFAAGEERSGDLGEVALDSRERLGEAALDRLDQVVPELLELVEAPLEVGALGRELLEALLLGLVLLLRERVHLAELLAAALEPLDSDCELVAVVTLGRLGPRRLEPSRSLGALRVDPRELDVRRGNAVAGLAGGTPQLDLVGAEAAQLRAQLGGARGIGLAAQSRLEALDVDAERGDEAIRGVDEPLERAPVDTRCRRRRSLFGSDACAPGLAGSRLGAARKLVGLGSKLPPPRLELEQDRLGCLACEPELAALRIPADPLLRHRRHLRGEQLLAGNDGQLEQELRGIATDENRQRAEPARPRALDQLEPAGRVVDHDGRGTLAQRRRDGALVSLVHVEQREHEALALLGQRARRRRQAFALGERLLQHREPLPRELRTGAQVVPLPLGRVDRPRELRGALAQRGLLGSGRERVQLGSQARGQRLGRLAAQLEALAARAQPVERRGGALARARGVGQLLLGAGAGRERRLELRLDRARGRPEPRARRRSSSRRRSAEPAEVERRDRGLQAARAPRRASRRARPRSPGARAAAGACAPRPRRRARARPASRRARASARRGGGGA